MSPWISTPNVAILLIVSDKEFIPFIYPFTRPLMFCANRNNVRAFNCALHHLDKLDLEARRELGDTIHSLPMLTDSDSLYTDMPEEMFELYEGEPEWIVSV